MKISAARSRAATGRADPAPAPASSRRSAVVGSSADGSGRVGWPAPWRSPPLQLAARQLVRIGADPGMRLRDRTRSKQLHPPRAFACAAGRVLWCRGSSRHARPPSARVQRGQRVLEDVGDPVARIACSGGAGCPPGPRARRPTARGTGSGPSAIRPGGVWDRPTIDSAVTDLPEPRFADDAEGPPRAPTRNRRRRRAIDRSAEANLGLQTPGPGQHRPGAPARSPPPPAWRGPVARCPPGRVRCGAKPGRLIAPDLRRRVPENVSQSVAQQVDCRSTSTRMTSRGFATWRRDDASAAGRRPACCRGSGLGRLAPSRAEGRRGRPFPGIITTDQWSTW